MERGKEYLRSRSDGERAWSVRRCAPPPPPPTRCPTCARRFGAEGNVPALPPTSFDGQTMFFFAFHDWRTGSAKRAGKMAQPCKRRNAWPICLTPIGVSLSLANPRRCASLCLLQLAKCCYLYVYCMYNVCNSHLAASKHKPTTELT